MEKVTVEDLPAGQQPQVAPSGPVTHTPTLGALELMSHFGIDTPTTQEKTKLQTIWNFAQTTVGSDDRESILLAVVRLKNQLGSPRIGENPLDKVYRFAKLKKQEALIQEELLGL